MAFLGSLDIAGSALTAERFRADIAAQNLANVNTTRTAAGTPYRRKQVVFQERPLDFGQALSKARGQLSGGGVMAAQIVESSTDFVPVYDPSHPDAGADGYVMMPNVNRAEEELDLMTAENAYDANLSALQVLASMINRTLEIGK